MIWIHKGETNPWENAPLSGVTFSGPDGRVNLETKPFVIYTVTSRMDLTAESTIAGNVVTHNVFEGQTALGKITDTYEENGWTREFCLSVPLSFYFENLPNFPLYHLTPNRLYQENGELIFREKADSNTGLYFSGENCILHTERNHLLVTAKAGSSRWTFRFEK
ncbi:MAG: hypothetical protein IKC56_02570 [Clostridia bacterium]|nr:hypothetical protein [Clostridia bacterium]